jgi:hypothetical protein
VRSHSPSTKSILSSLIKTGFKSPPGHWLHWRCFEQSPSLPRGKCQIAT